MKRLLFLLILIISAALLPAQSLATQPTPQPLPYFQDFVTLIWGSGIYPEGMQGWRIGGMSDAYNLSEPVSNRPMEAGADASTTRANLQNYKGKIGFICSDIADISLVFAIQTTGQRNISLSYDIMTIRNPYGYLGSNRINEATMLYRVGNSGPFTMLDGLEYVNNSILKTSAGDTSPQKLESRSIVLPAECENQPEVQLRLASRYVSGSGGSPGFTIDNIVVTGEEMPTVPVILSSFTATALSTAAVRLDWCTQSETGVLGFYLLRGKHDPASAELISALIPATNSSQTQNYSHTDSSLTEPGLYHYWLQILDLDGSQAWHGPVSVILQSASDSQTPQIPLQTGITSVFPNPFNPDAFIEYHLEKASPVSFSIYDKRGRLIRRLEPAPQNAGSHRLYWDGLDGSGSPCPTGIYHIRMDAGSQKYFARAALIK
ncbi:MAG: hypothetical protein GXY81_08255 [Candidatus Cloacimonetes bacterium]|nr:hypothetical protein [Candidatus Cloacimonadota bacterium]